MKYVVNCDWLALSCEAPAAFVLPALESEYVCGVEHFKVRPATEFNPYYSFSRLLYWHGQPAFHFFASPRHPNANPRDCQLKVANRLLYSGDWLSCLRKVLSAMALKINHVQRCDVCCDFNSFAGGRKPAQFIRDYFSKPRVSRPSFIRRGSNKFRTYGQKRLGLLDFETLSFGTRDSPVQVNLYNKSLELKGKDKPYIRDCWQANGLDVDSVWRVEFSLNHQGMMLHNIKADYITEVTFDDMGIYSKLHAMFVSFAERYWKFYYVTKEDEIKRTKVEKLRPVVLFEYATESDFKPIALCRKSNTGEKERRAASLLANELNYSETLSPEEARTLRGALGYLQQKYAVKAVATKSVEDDVLRHLMNGIVTLGDFYSEKSHRERVNRWLQVLRQQRFDKKYNEYCKAMQYLDREAECYLESLRPLLDTFDPACLPI